MTAIDTSYQQKWYPLFTDVKEHLIYKHEIAEDILNKLTEEEMIILHDIIHDKREEVKEV